MSLGSEVLGTFAIDCCPVVAKGCLMVLFGVSRD